MAYIECTSGCVSKARHVHLLRMSSVRLDIGEWMASMLDTLKDFVIQCRELCTQRVVLWKALVYTAILLWTFTIAMLVRQYLGQLLVSRYSFTSNDAATYAC